MKKFFSVICSPLLRVNNNAYTFLGGIVISLSTNIFTSICIDEMSFFEQWNLYLSSFLFAMVSALLLFMAAKMSGFQEFANNPGNSDWKKSIVDDATSGDYIKWVFRYLFLFVLIVAGITFLAINVS